MDRFFTLHVLSCSSGTLYACSFFKPEPTKGGGLIRFGRNAASFAIDCVALGIPIGTAIRVGVSIGRIALGILG